MTVDPSKLDDRQREYMRNMGLKDPIYMAREILGLDKSKIEWRDAAGKKRGATKEGDEYGVSRHGPHRDMMKLLESDELYKMLQAPRSSYKSTIATAWIIQQIVRNPDVRILYAMDTFTQSKKKLSQIKQHLESNELLIALYGDMKGSDWSKVQFTVSNRTDPSVADPTFTAGAVGTNLTGSHFDIVILDDIVTPDNVKTEAGIQTVREYFEMVDPFIDPGGREIVIGTRYADGDLYGHIEREMKDEFEILKLECGMEVVKDENGREGLAGEPLFPALTKDFLLSKLRRMGSKAFTSQYLNRCLSSDEQLFFREQFSYTGWEDWMGSMRGFICTDTAVTTHSKGCLSVVAVVGLDAANVAYLFDLKVGRWAPFTFVEELLETFQQWSGKIQINKVLMEDTTLNQTFRAMILDGQQERGLRMNICAVPRGQSDGSKDQRIESLQGRFEQRRFVVVDEGVPRFFQNGAERAILWDAQGFRDETGVAMPCGELVDEFIRFPVGVRKDIPDALADIDATDKNGRRVCNGSGTKREFHDRNRGPGASMSPIDFPSSRNELLERQRNMSAGKWSRLTRRMKRNGSNW